MADFKPSAANLTGVWQGLYSYANSGEHTPFTATLLETGSHVGGSTHEICLVEGRSRATLFALVDGIRRDRAVHFVKTYDGSAGWDHSVAYEGAINEDGTEIQGSWRVRGGMTGRFLMTRPAGKAIAVKRRAMAKA